MKIAVETYCRIAFANGNEEPAKGLQGRIWQCRVVPWGVGVR
jgi:hypothetical protein